MNKKIFFMILASLFAGHYCAIHGGDIKTNLVNIEKSLGLMRRKVRTLSARLLILNDSLGRVEAKYLIATGVRKDRLDTALPKRSLYWFLFINDLLQNLIGNPPFPPAFDAILNIDSGINSRNVESLTVQDLINEINKIAAASHVEELRNKLLTNEMIDAVLVNINFKQPAPQPGPQPSAAQPEQHLGPRPATKIDLSKIMLSLEDRKKIIDEIWDKNIPEEVQVYFEDGKKTLNYKIGEINKSLNFSKELSAQVLLETVNGALDFLKNYGFELQIVSQQIHKAIVSLKIKVDPQPQPVSAPATGPAAGSASEWRDVKTLAKKDMGGDYVEICKKHADRILMGDTNQYQRDGRSACPFIAALFAVGIVNDNVLLSRDLINKKIELGVQHFKEFIAAKKGDVEHAAFDEASGKIWPQIEKPFLVNSRMFTLNWNDLVDGMSIENVLNEYNNWNHHPWACVITKSPETTVLFQLEKNGAFYYFDSHGRGCNAFILSFSSVAEVCSFLKAYILPIDPDVPEEELLSMDFITKHP